VSLKIFPPLLLNAHHGTSGELDLIDKNIALLLKPGGLWNRNLGSRLQLQASKYLFPVSSEISDLLLFVSYFASQSKGMKFGDYFFDVCCVN